jgi:hypothetical protein
MLDYLTILYENVKPWRFNICLEGLKETKKKKPQPGRPVSEFITGHGPNASQLERTGSATLGRTNRNVYFPLSICE